MEETTRKPSAIICDIDGTVSDHNGLRGHYEYDKVLNDQPIITVIDVIEDLVAYDAEWTPYHRKVLFVTGRPDIDNVRIDTKTWLRRNFSTIIPVKDSNLFMRPAFLADKPEKRDYRQDYIVKEEIYRTKIQPYYNIQFAIDDRPQVLRMWREQGIFTFAVGTPWIEF